MNNEKSNIILKGKAHHRAALRNRRGPERGSDGPGLRSGGFETTLHFPPPLLASHSLVFNFQKLLVKFCIQALIFP